MKTIYTLMICAGFLSGTALAETVNFDDAKAGASPPGWKSAVTGSGSAKWSVEQESSAPSMPNVLKQSGVGRFPICIYESAKLKDGSVEVKFKPIEGKEDQAGGVIWRVQDSNNYYIARANALEDNVTIYHTIRGKRVAFKSISTKVKSGVWHTFRVDFEGSKFTVTFDGTKVIEAIDQSFPNAGTLGVCTKSHSATLFDDFTFPGY